MTRVLGSRKCTHTRYNSHIFCFDEGNCGTWNPDAKNMEI